MNTTTKKDSSHNIKINYSYRDAGNYKSFDFIIFENPDQIPFDFITNSINSKLIDTDFFVPVKWKIPSLTSACLDFELDHEWHEIEKIELTKEVLTE